MTDSKIERRLQVARQHRAVAALATEIAMLSFGSAEMLLSGEHDAIADIQGRCSHAWMEALGEMLNNVDAANPDTIRWMTPIYEKARIMFPLLDAALSEGE